MDVFKGTCQEFGKVFSEDLTSLQEIDDKVYHHAEALTNCVKLVLSNPESPSVQELWSGLIRSSVGTLLQISSPPSTKSLHKFAETIKPWLIDGNFRGICFKEMQHLYKLAVDGPWYPPMLQQLISNVPLQPHQLQDVFNEEVAFMEYRLRALHLTAKFDQLTCFGTAALLHPGMKKNKSFQKTYQSYINLDLDESELLKQIQYFDLSVTMDVIGELMIENVDCLKLCNATMTFLWQHKLTDHLEEITLCWIRCLQKNHPGYGMFDYITKNALHSENAIKSVQQCAALTKCLWQVEPDKSRMTCVEILFHALHLISNDDENKEQLKKGILSSIAYFLPNSQVSRCCILTIFIYEPSIQHYFDVAKAYKALYDREKDIAMDCKAHLRLHLLEFLKQDWSQEFLRSDNWDWPLLRRLCYETMSEENIAYVQQVERDEELKEMASQSQDESSSTTQNTSSEIGEPSLDTTHATEISDSEISEQGKTSDSCDCIACDMKHKQLGSPRLATLHSEATPADMGILKDCHSKKKVKSGEDEVWVCPEESCQKELHSKNGMSNHLRRKHSWTQPEVHVFYTSLEKEFFPQKTRSSRSDAMRSRSFDLAIGSDEEQLRDDELPETKEAAEDKSLCKEEQIIVKDQYFSQGELVQKAGCQNDKQEAQEIEIQQEEMEQNNTELEARMKSRENAGEDTGLYPMDRMSGSKKVKKQLVQEENSVGEDEASTTHQSKDAVLLSGDVTVEKEGEFQTAQPAKPSSPLLNQSPTPVPSEMKVEAHRCITADPLDTEYREPVSVSTSQPSPQLEQPNFMMTTEAALVGLSAFQDALKPQPQLSETRSLTEASPELVVEGVKTAHRDHTFIRCPVGSCSKVYQHRHTVQAHLEFRHKIDPKKAGKMAKSAKRVTSDDQNDALLLQSNQQAGVGTWAIGVDIRKSQGWYWSIDEFILEEFDSTPPSSLLRRDPSLRSSIGRDIITLFGSAPHGYDLAAAENYIKTNWRFARDDVGVSSVKSVSSGNSEDGEMNFEADKFEFSHHTEPVVANPPSIPKTLLDVKSLLQMKVKLKHPVVTNPKEVVRFHKDSESNEKSAKNNDTDADVSVKHCFCQTDYTMLSPLDLKNHYHNLPSVKYRKLKGGKNKVPYKDPVSLTVVSGICVGTPTRTIASQCCHIDKKYIYHPTIKVVGKKLQEVREGIVKKKKMKMVPEAPPAPALFSSDSDEVVTVSTRQVKRKYDAQTMYQFAEKYQDIQVDNGVGGESPGVGTKQTFEDAFNSATNSLLHGEKNRTKKQIKHLQNDRPAHVPAYYDKVLGETPTSVGAPEITKMTPSKNVRPKKHKSQNSRSLAAPLAKKSRAMGQEKESRSQESLVSKEEVSKPPTSRPDYKELLKQAEKMTKQISNEKGLSRQNSSSSLKKVESDSEPGAIRTVDRLTAQEIPNYRIDKCFPTAAGDATVKRNTKTAHGKRRIALRKLSSTSTSKLNDMNTTTSNLNDSLSHDDSMSMSSEHDSVCSYISNPEHTSADVMCSECNRTFSSAFALTCHMRKRHKGHSKKMFFPNQETTSKNDLEPPDVKEACSNSASFRLAQNLDASVTERTPPRVTPDVSLIEDASMPSSIPFSITESSPSFEISLSPTDDEIANLMIPDVSLKDGKYFCFVPNCIHTYLIRGSLLRHIKRKHPEVYSQLKWSEKYAKKLEKSQSVSKSIICEVIEEHLQSSNVEDVDRKKVSASDNCYVLAQNNADLIPLYVRRTPKRMAQAEAIVQMQLSAASPSKRGWSSAQELAFFYNKRARRKIVSAISPADRTPKDKCPCVREQDLARRKKIFHRRATSGEKSDASTDSFEAEYEAQLPCWLCQTLFHRRTNLTTHIQHHLRNIDTCKYRCDFIGCLFAFNTEEDLESHKKRHAGRRPHICLFCPNQARIFRSGRKLAIHEHIFHKELKVNTNQMRKQMCLTPPRGKLNLEKYLPSTEEETTLTPTSEDINDPFLGIGHRRLKNNDICESCASTKKPRKSSVAKPRCCDHVLVQDTYLVLKDVLNAVVKFTDLRQNLNYTDFGSTLIDLFDSDDINEPEQANCAKCNNLPERADEGRGDDKNIPIVMQSSLLKESPPKHCLANELLATESPEKTSPQKVSPPKESPRKEALFNKSPPKQSPQKEALFNKSPPKESPQKEMLFNKSPPKESPEKEALFKNSPPKESPEKETLFNKSPPKESPEREALFNKSPPKTSSSKTTPVPTEDSLPTVSDGNGTNEAALFFDVSHVMHKLVCDVEIEDQVSFLRGCGVVPVGITYFKTNDLLWDSPSWLSVYGYKHDAFSALLLADQLLFSTIYQPPMAAQVTSITEVDDEDVAKNPPVDNAAHGLKENSAQSASSSFDPLVDVAASMDHTNDIKETTDTSSSVDFGAVKDVNSSCLLTSNDGQHTQSLPMVMDVADLASKSPPLSSNKEQPTVSSSSDHLSHATDISSSTALTHCNSVLHSEAFAFPASVTSPLAVKTDAMRTGPKCWSIALDEEFSELTNITEAPPIYRQLYGRHYVVVNPDLNLPIQSLCGVSTSYPVMSDDARFAAFTAQDGQMPPVDNQSDVVPQEDISCEESVISDLECSKKQNETCTEVDLTQSSVKSNTSRSATNGEEVPDSLFFKGFMEDFKSELSIKKTGKKSSSLLPKVFRRGRGRHRNSFDRNTCVKKRRSMADIVAFCDQVAPTNVKSRNKTKSKATRKSTSDVKKKLQTKPKKKNNDVSPAASAEAKPRTKPQKPILTKRSTKQKKEQSSLFLYKSQISLPPHRQLIPVVKRLAYSGADQIVRENTLKRLSPTRPNILRKKQKKRPKIAEKISKEKAIVESANSTADITQEIITTAFESDTASCASVLSLAISDLVKTNATPVSQAGIWLEHNYAKQLLPPGNFDDPLGDGDAILLNDSSHILPIGNNDENIASYVTIGSDETALDQINEMSPVFPGFSAYSMLNPSFFEQKSCHSRLLSIVEGDSVCKLVSSIKSPSPAVREFTSGLNSSPESPSKPTLYKCNGCHERYTSSREYLTHLYLKHIYNRKAYPCQFRGMNCVYDYDTIEELNQHMVLHLSPLPYPCLFCTKWCASLSELKVHFTIHPDINDEFSRTIGDVSQRKNRWKQILQHDTAVIPTNAAVMLGQAPAPLPGINSPNSNYQSSFEKFLHERKSSSEPDAFVMPMSKGKAPSKPTARSSLLKKKEKISLHLLPHADKNYSFASSSALESFATEVRTELLSSNRSKNVSNFEQLASHMDVNVVAAAKRQVDVPAKSLMKKQPKQPANLERFLPKSHPLYNMLCDKSTNGKREQKGDRNRAKVCDIIVSKNQVAFPDSSKPSITKSCAIVAPMSRLVQKQAQSDRNSMNQYSRNSVSANHAVNALTIKQRQANRSGTENPLQTVRFSTSSFVNSAAARTNQSTHPCPAVSAVVADVVQGVRSQTSRFHRQVVPHYPRTSLAKTPGNGRSHSLTKTTVPSCTMATSTARKNRPMTDNASIITTQSVSPQSANFQSVGMAAFLGHNTADMSHLASEQMFPYHPVQSVQTASDRLVVQLDLPVKSTHRRLSHPTSSNTIARPMAIGQQLVDNAAANFRNQLSSTLGQGLPGNSCSSDCAILSLTGQTGKETARKSSSVFPRFHPNNSPTIRALLNKRARHAEVIRKQSNFTPAGSVSSTNSLNIPHSSASDGHKPHTRLGNLHSDVSSFPNLQIEQDDLERMSLKDDTSQPPHTISMTSQFSHDVVKSYLASDVKRKFQKQFPRRRKKRSTERPASFQHAERTIPHRFYTERDCLRPDNVKECVYCNNLYASRFDLQKHLEIDHSLYLCGVPYCSYTTSSRKNLKRHFYIFHKRPTLDDSLSLGKELTHVAHQEEAEHSRRVDCFKNNRLLKINVAENECERMKCDERNLDLDLACSVWERTLDKTALREFRSRAQKLFEADDDEIVPELLYLELKLFAKRRSILEADTPTAHCKCPLGHKRRLEKDPKSRKEFYFHILTEHSINEINSFMKKRWRRSERNRITRKNRREIQRAQQAAAQSLCRDVIQTPADAQKQNDVTSSVCAANENICHDDVDDLESTVFVSVDVERLVAEENLSPEDEAGTSLNETEDQPDDVDNDVSGESPSVDDDEILFSHITIPAQSDEIRSYKCRFADCAKIFWYLNDFRNHMKKHSAASIARFNVDGVGFDLYEGVVRLDKFDIIVEDSADSCCDDTCNDISTDSLDSVDYTELHSTDDSADSFALTRRDPTLGIMTSPSTPRVLLKKLEPVVDKFVVQLKCDDDLEEKC
ncbi:uncharacterized protein LOC143464891 isoform X2 [Clavelina lepadiformis]|uniref:uncharacterized protein LOC143464891 isoform X2 n=1 Tax=Clavelina lepadiformis TaxID=159417 RepID=UPI00404321A9